MPQPSSITERDSIPPPLTSTLISEALASIELSINSLAIAAGRSITSPAAILAATKRSSTLIFAIGI